LPARSGSQQSKKQKVKRQKRKVKENGESEKQTRQELWAAPAVFSFDLLLFAF
jgi:hypothetical protein